MHRNFGLTRNSPTLQSAVNYTFIIFPLDFASYGSPNFVHKAFGRLVASGQTETTTVDLSTLSTTVHASIGVDTFFSRGHSTVTTAINSDIF